MRHIIALSVFTQPAKLCLYGHNPQRSVCTQPAGVCMQSLHGEHYIMQPAAHCMCMAPRALSLCTQPAEHYLHTAGEQSVCTNPQNSVPTHKVRRAPLLTQLAHIHTSPTELPELLSGASTVQLSSSQYCYVQGNSETGGICIQVSFCQCLWGFTLPSCSA